MKYFNKLLATLLILTSSSLIAGKAELEDIKKIYSKQEKTNLRSNRILGGFLDIRTQESTNRVDIEKVKNDGYNLIIVGFAEVYDTNIGANLSGNISKLSMQTALDKIKQAKKLGLKVLLAVGGIPNTFHPGVNLKKADPKILGKSMSDSQIKTLATNIVNFLKKYNIDGIDFNIRVHTSDSFIKNLIAKIKDINPKLIIAAEPKVNDYKLVSKGRNNDYDKAIESGNINYLFIQEYNAYPQYDVDYIAESYDKIVKNSQIPLDTKVLIGEPTNAVAGDNNTIYHPGGDESKSLSTEEAVSLMLPQLELLKNKPRFAGIVGWSLNTDYAADLYGDDKHKAGSFAESLKKCIYNNICATKFQKQEDPIIAGYLPLWGRSSSYNVSGEQINSVAINLDMPKDQEYCDKYPNVCKYNTIIVAYLTYTNSSGFELTFDSENGISKKTYTPKEVKEFVKYMKSKGKHIIISFGSEFSHINWKTIDLNSIEKIITEYGFNGVNFDLVNSDLPKTSEIKNIAAKKIKNVIEKINKNKKKEDDFWLTFSPNWQYITASINKDSKEGTFENHKYVELINKIGIDKINYIFLKTYSDEAIQSIFGPYKNQDKKYEKVSPADNYSKFLSSLVWSLTTQEGYNANVSKYKQKALIIPPKKLVLLVPATEGVVAESYFYTLNPENISNIMKEVEKNKASFGGFALWSMDFDATRIKRGRLTVNYFHKPWSMTNTITNIKLPEVISHVTDSPKKKVTKKQDKKIEIIDTGIINYPDGLGAYTSNTIVEYQGKRYKCLSIDVQDLCNNNSYIPNGLYGYLAWKELDKNVKKVKYKKIISYDDVPVYPDGIGNYKSNIIVKADGNKVFKCMNGKEALCNNIIYFPTGYKGYQAWNDITAEISYREKNKDQQD